MAFVGRRQSLPSTSQAELPHRPEELSQILGEQRRLFHGGEVAASGHGGPTGDVVLRSTHERGQRRTSLGNRATPVGTSMKGTGRLSAPLCLVSR